MNQLISALASKYPADQRTDEWKLQRLGFLTGSAFGKLMGASRTKGEKFSKTALDAIYRIASERMLDAYTIENAAMWQEYEQQTSVWSKAMQFGTDHETEARDYYTLITGRDVTETGSIPSDIVEWVSASPDGLIDDNGRLGVWECKCPLPATFVRYMVEIHDADSLRKVNPDYYWQVQCEMFVTGASFCDFSVYSPFLNKSMHIVRIERDEQAIKEIVAKAIEVNEFISEIMNLNN